MIFSTRFSDASNKFLQEIHDGLPEISQDLFVALFKTLSRPSEAYSALYKIIQEVDSGEAQDALIFCVEEGTIDLDEVRALERDCPSLFPTETYDYISTLFQE